ncbi:MAG: DUF4252 domain-containing protein [Marinirhabdus sp.]
MKKVILIFALAIFSLPAIAQNPFASFENDDDVSSVVMTKQMFKLLSKMDLEADDPEVTEYLKLINNLKEVKIFTTDKAATAAKMKRSVTSYLKANSTLSELMRVKDDGKNIVFYSREGKNENYVNELLMFLDGDIDDKARSVVMSITGNIDLRQISKLTKDLDVPGSDQLKNVKSKKQ